MLSLLLLLFFCFSDGMIKREMRKEMIEEAKGNIAMTYRRKILGTESLS